MTRIGLHAQTSGDVYTPYARRRYTSVTGPPYPTHTRTHPQGGVISMLSTWNDPRQSGYSHAITWADNLAVGNTAGAEVRGR